MIFPSPWVPAMLMVPRMLVTDADADHERDRTDRPHFHLTLQTTYSRETRRRLGVNEHALDPDHTCRVRLRIQRQSRLEDDGLFEVGGDDPGSIGHIHAIIGPDPFPVPEAEFGTVV